VVRHRTHRAIARHEPEPGGQHVAQMNVSGRAQSKVDQSQVSPKICSLMRRGYNHLSNSAPLSPKSIDDLEDCSDQFHGVLVDVLSEALLHLIWMPSHALNLE
jgi:hypothetical protein